MRKIKMEYNNAIEILKSCKTGVLSTVSLDGIPYGVPINYFYLEEDKSIYFHCATKGRKIDNINENNHVSFTVIADEQIIEDLFTTRYESIIVEGKAYIIKDLSEKERLLNILCDILTPTAFKKKQEAVSKYINNVNIVKIKIDKLSGKKNMI